jgi:N6-L-threonylcarbamoyladenine synthase
MNGEKMKDIIIMGIESSCDETSVAIVKNGREVLSNVIDTQISIHEKFGGVVPEIASRNHVEAISNVMKRAIEEAKINLNDIDAIACTYGPGLVGALLVGVSYAKALSYSLNKPLIAVNHIKGHIAANYITYKELKPPFLCMLMSGGNTQIVYVKDYTDFEVLGKTKDDAIGEAFDKVARVIGLGYPGGPKIDKI